MVDPTGNAKDVFATTTDTKSGPWLANGIHEADGSAPVNRYERRLLRFRPRTKEAHALRSRKYLSQSLESFLD